MSTSVVLPNYNHGALLSRSLHALLRQRLPAKEIIVVDDGSTDNSVDVVTEIQRSNPTVQLVRHEKNQGTLKAIESGLAVCSGEFVAICAADDFVLPDLVERAERSLQKHPTLAFFCSSVIILDQEDNIAGVRPFLMPRQGSGPLDPERVRSKIRYSDNWFVGSSVIYRRKFLGEIGYPDMTLGSLADGLANRLLAFRYGFFFDSKPLSACRIYSGSFSARSILAADESARLLKLGGRWITTHFPADVRETYRRDFDRRLRFSIARLRLLWTWDTFDIPALITLVGLTGVDEQAVSVLRRSPIAPTKLILSWLTFRIRPYRLWSIIPAALRYVIFDRMKVPQLRRSIASALGKSANRAATLNP